MNLEPGIYPAKVAAIDEIDGQYGLQWRFEFSIDGHDDTPWAWATAKLGTKTKLWRWSTALLGRPLAVGERLTKAQLIGLPCSVIIKERADVEAFEGVRRYVDDILGIAKPKKANPAAAPLADACFCGKPISSYSATGQALCEKHAAEAIQE
jgi:hypothetical protein